jgi:hypothetical protein
MPGAVAGLIFTMLFRPSLAAENQSFFRSRLLYHGGIGAAALALPVLFHALLSQVSQVDPLALLLAAAEGAVWGFFGGAGIFWIFSTHRPYWQTIPLFALVCALTLLVAETAAAVLAANAFQEAGIMMVLTAGALMPLSLLGAVWASHRLAK